MMLPWPWARLEQRAVCAERRTGGSGRRSGKPLLTPLPMRHDFSYLVAIMDWASRKVLAWRLSNTLESDFCVEALEEALARYRKPEIFNSDQGSPFTSLAFTQVLKDAGIKISMDGKRRWMDNRATRPPLRNVIERLWRSLKYECVYLQAFETGSEARVGIGRWIDYSMPRRPIPGHAIFSSWFSSVSSATTSFRSRASRRRALTSPVRGLAGRIARKPLLAGSQEVLRPALMETLGDALAAALLGNAVFAAQAVEHDPDPLLRRTALARRAADILDKMCRHLFLRPGLLSQSSLLDGYDDPASLRCSVTHICLTGADAGLPSRARASDPPQACELSLR